MENYLQILNHSIINLSTYLHGYKQQTQREICNKPQDLPPVHPDIIRQPHMQSATNWMYLIHTQYIYGTIIRTRFEEDVECIDMQKGFPSHQTCMITSCSS